MTKERDIEKDLKPSVGDYAHGGMRAGLSMPPFLGGPLKEFFSMVIAPPLERRRNEWLIEIYNRLQLLEKTSDKFKPENLVKNENFFSIFLQATQIAMRTHQSEKLEALRNTVTNSVLMPTVDENLQMIFLNFIDRYTPWHLKLLQFADNPHQYAECHRIEYSYYFNMPSYDRQGTVITLGSIIESIFPELEEKEKFYDLIIKELISNGLLHEEQYLTTRITESCMLVSRTTTMGKQFLQFISNNPTSVEELKRKFLMKSTIEKNFKPRKI